MKKVLISLLLTLGFGGVSQARLENPLKLSSEAQWVYDLACANGGDVLQASCWCNPQAAAGATHEQKNFMHDLFKRGLAMLIKQGLVNDDGKLTCGATSKNSNSALKNSQLYYRLIQKTNGVMWNSVVAKFDA